jgi:catechol 2,3-dioxygenase-like lactoylglutathione lyase family enzyme
MKTPDPEKTVKFYVDNLGATIIRQSPSGGYRLNLHGLALNVTGFNKDQKRGQMYGMEHLAIDTDDFDALVAKLKGKGIKILEEPIVGSGNRACFFEGPEGVQLEFIEMKKEK